jgi:multidrug efflux pump subunit AcrB
MKAFLGKPVSVLSVFISLLLLGLVASRHIPILPLPDVEIPEISVYLNNNELSANELEESMIAGLRNNLSQIANIEHLESETKDGTAVVRIKFRHGTSMHHAFIDVNEKVDQAMSAFPARTERPRVVKASLTDIPVLYINMQLGNQDTGDADIFKQIRLSELATETIKKRLEQLPEVALVDVTGIVYPEVRIIPDPAWMMAVGIKLEQFSNILELENVSLGSAVVRDGIFEYVLSFSSGGIHSVDDIRNVKFRWKDRIYQLGDIASVNIGEKQSEGSFYIGDKSGINLAIFQHDKGRIGDLKEIINSSVAHFRKDYPQVLFTVTRDQTALLDASITNLLQDLVFGGILAYFILFFFIRNWRIPMLIGVTIPSALIISLLLFYVIGLSINIISLSGLVLGLGLMIDNAIIVIDNIVQKCMDGLTFRRACLFGTVGVIKPMISSSFATVSVFIPLIFLGGISGALFYDEAIAITLGIGASLLIALMLLPTLFILFERSILRGGLMEQRIREDSLFTRLYEKGISWVFRNKLMTMLVVVIVLVIGYGLLTVLHQEQLPQTEQPDLLISIDWNENIPASENLRRVQQMIAPYMDKVHRIESYVGQQQFILAKEKGQSAAVSTIHLINIRRQYQDDIKTAILRSLQLKYPKSVFAIRPPSSIFEQIFDETENMLVAHISAADNASFPDPATTGEILNSWKQLLGDKSIMSVPTTLNKELVLEPEQLLLYNLTSDGVYRQLKSMISDNSLLDIRNGNQFLPVVIGSRNASLDDILRNTTVENAQGVSIPVKNLLHVKSSFNFRIINGGGGGKYIRVPLDITDPERTIALLENSMKDDTLKVSFEGAYFERKTLIRNIIVVLLLAVLLLYFILAAQFESMIQPFIVLAELPISIGGAFIMLYLFNSSINIMSLIGIIVICGIILNDSILKIDTINTLVRKNRMPVLEAIHLGGKMRLHAILMTSLTTTLSVIPFLFGNDLGNTLQRPLSLTVIGGMIFGTFVSLFFIPLLYWWCYRKKEVKI